jgi:hypothetical protein
MCYSVKVFTSASLPKSPYCAACYFALMGVTDVPISCCSLHVMRVVSIGRSEAPSLTLEVGATARREIWNSKHGPTALHESKRELGSE